MFEKDGCVKMSQNPTRKYLGDGVYAEFDGEHIWLTTENGIEVTNRIALDYNVSEQAADYISTYWPGALIETRNYVMDAEFSEVDEEIDESQTL